MEDELWRGRARRASAPPRTSPDEPDTWEGWEDSAVAARPARATTCATWRSSTSGSATPTTAPSLYGHFGQGCVHTRIPFGLTDADGVAKYRRFMEQAADLVASYGGSFSGEHGDGQSRGELLPKMFGAEIMRAFGELKAIFDPDDRMNPGKVVAPPRLDEHLRLGGSWSPHHAGELHFAYPEDGGSFVAAATRCVGVGKCRQHSHKGGAVMCPSYQATMEEEHSTRGRARLLFEMLRWSPRLADHRRLALDCGTRRAGPLPGLQGLQERLPGQRGHGDLQGRVPRSPLRRAAAPSLALRARLAADAGRRRKSRSCRRCRQRPRKCAAAAPAGRARGWPGTARGSAVRRRDAAAVVDAPGRGAAGHARRRAAVAGHVHQPLPPAHRPSGRRAARGRRLDRSGCRPNACVAG